MATDKTIDRDWIVAQFSKGITAERAMEGDAKSTAESPPDPSLGVLYHQIAKDDDRHAALIETIATRYGYQATKNKPGGLTSTFERLKDAVSELGSSPQQRLEHDLGAKASAIHWATAWVYVFEQIGDTASAQELASMLTEEKSHHAALQQGLNLLLVQGTQGQHA